jgi:hypothetical protein
MEHLAKVVRNLDASLKSSTMAAQSMNVQLLRLDEGDHAILIHGSAAC